MSISFSALNLLRSQSYKISTRSTSREMVPSEYLFAIMGEVVVDLGRLPFIGYIEGTGTALIYKDVGL